MRMAILCFALGVGWLQRQAALPGWGLLAALLAVSAGLTFSAWRLRGRWRRASVCMAGLLAGFLWAAAIRQWRLADRLPTENEGRDIRLSGVIASLPQAYENGLRFEFAVEQAEAALPSRISLAWYAGRRPGGGRGAPCPAAALHAGERWQLTVRLKRPHGNLNPHGFDYEAWLFERGVRATGYVRDGRGQPAPGGLRGAPAYAVERCASGSASASCAALPERDYAGVLVALVVGDQRAIDGGLWQLFARTGISHLMSISGMHVTMVAALGAWLVSLLWRRRPALMLRLPAQKAAAAAGWATAFAYCLLAGFGVPAQRTLIMLSVVALALWLGRAAAGSRVLALALLVVLLRDPWAVLAAGFWLSFGAVGAALLCQMRAHRAHRAAALAGRVGPRAMGGDAGPDSGAAGAVPAVLARLAAGQRGRDSARQPGRHAAGAARQPLLPFDLLLVLAHPFLAEWLMAFIEWLAGLPLAVWQQARAAVPGRWLLAACWAARWLLLPRGFPFARRSARC
jgi:competence protein ComEC